MAIRKSEQPAQTTSTNPNWVNFEVRNEDGVLLGYMNVPKRNMKNPEDPSGLEAYINANKLTVAVPQPVEQEPLF